MSSKNYPYSTSVSIFSRYIRKKLMNIDALNYKVWVKSELWNDSRKVTDKEIFLSSLWLYCGMINLKGYMPDRILEVYSKEDQMLLARYNEAEKKAEIF